MEVALAAGATIGIDRDQLRRGAPSAACRGRAARLSASHEEKAEIHWRCARVSGTSSPRDRRIVSIAVFASWPPEMRAAAAISADQGSERSEIRARWSQKRPIRQQGRVPALSLGLAARSGSAAYTPVWATDAPIRIGGCASVTGATAHASAARPAMAKTFRAWLTGADSTAASGSAAG